MHPKTITRGQLCRIQSMAFRPKYSRPRINCGWAQICFEYLEEEADQVNRFSEKGWALGFRLNRWLRGPLRKESENLRGRREREGLKEKLAAFNRIPGAKPEKNNYLGKQLWSSNRICHWILYLWPSDPDLLWFAAVPSLTGFGHFHGFKQSSTFKWPLLWGTALQQSPASCLEHSPDFNTACMLWKSLPPICLAYMFPQRSLALVFASSTWSFQAVSYLGQMLLNFSVQMGTRLA